MEVHVSWTRYKVNRQDYKRYWWFRAFRAALRSKLQHCCILFPADCLVTAKHTSRYLRLFESKTDGNLPASHCNFVSKLCLSFRWLQDRQAFSRSFWWNLKIMKVQTWFNVKLSFCFTHPNPCVASTKFCCHLRSLFYEEAHSHVHKSSFVLLTRTFL